MGSIVQPCTVAFWWSMQAWRMEELIQVTSPHACLSIIKPFGQYVSVLSVLPSCRRRTPSAVSLGACLPIVWHAYTHAGTIQTTKVVLKVLQCFF